MYEGMKLMESNTPLVSVYCTAYNHEKYIRDCLNGFVMQKTDFSFEAIIHDDASTDQTQAIIREYEQLYPSIIKPIYQTVNQHQLKVPMIKKFILPKVRGKYVAICEGDDYWIDENKLQEQVQLMEDNPDCHFCVCGVQEVFLNGKPLGVLHPSTEIPSGYITPNDFIRYAGTYSFQTSSYLVRYEDWKEYILNPPTFRKHSDIGDLPMLLYFGSMGPTGYVNKIMSCYRRGAPTSYSTQKNNWSVEKRIEHFEKQANVWRAFNKFSNQKYCDTCNQKIAQNLFGYHLLLGSAKTMFKSENKLFLRKFRFRKKMYLLLACVFKKKMKQHYLSEMKKREKQQQSLWERL